MVNKILRRGIGWLRLFLSILFVGLGGAVCTAAGPLQLVQTIPLPGVKGRIDHMEIDLKGERLFVTALGNDTLEILDLAGSKALSSIEGFSEPQGVLFLPGRNPSRTRK